ncbi:MAG: pilus assembly protein HicB [Gammaproteobacteria bacterium]
MEYGNDVTPKKIRELIDDLKNAGFSEMKKSDQYHKWVEWSEEDGVNMGKYPDLITGIHSDNPTLLYQELCDVIEDVIRHFESEGCRLPKPRVRPMQEVA